MMSKLKAAWWRYVERHAVKLNVANRLAALKRARNDVERVALKHTHRERRAVLEALEYVDAYISIEQATMIHLARKPEPRECADHNWATHQDMQGFHAQQHQRVCLACARHEFHRADMILVGWVFIDFDDKLAEKKRTPGETLFVVFK